MKYATEIRLVGKRMVAWAWSDQEEKKIVLTSLSERLQFFDKLKAGDEVFFPAGGLSLPLAAQLARKGIIVNLISPSRLHQENTSRQDLFSVLKKVAQDHPEYFNRWLPEESEILRLRAVFEEWQRTMEQRKKVAIQAHQEFYKEVLTYPSKYQDLSTEVLKRMTKERVESDPHYRWLKDRENQLQRRVRAVVSGMELYRQVFADLDGCGPLIAARIIVYVRNIERFPSWEQFATYCGFGLKDGRKQRKRRGEVLNYHPKLRSAIQYLWIREQIYRRKRGKLAEILQQRIEKEMREKREGEEKKGTPTGRAMWWLGRRLCRQIYYRWRSFGAT